LQDFDVDNNYTDAVQVGPNAEKNCTPPGKRFSTTHINPHTIYLLFEFNRADETGR